MRVAVVGAGFAGLATAKVLAQFGHEPVVYEKAPDVGGVWSATRRYPGLTTQNNKRTYSLTDYPMPDHFPEWPASEQVQQYLADYAEHFGLGPALRLGTEVVSAELDEAAGAWTVTGRDATGDTVEGFDHLVVANGIFCDPLVPDFPGAEEFRAAGGRLCHTCDFHTLEEARGRHLVVVGYGKSSCDLAAAIAGAAAGVTVVARQLLWKVPRRIGGRVHNKWVLLTRLSEGLFRHIEPKGFERFLHGPGRPLRQGMMSSLQRIVTRQLRLRRLGLVPDGPLERIARSTVSMATEGFYEAVESGAITVHRDASVTRLLVRDGRTMAELSDGAVVPADAVVCGTGFHQRVPFFSPELQRRLEDDRGNFELYHQVHPLRVPRLSFSGYNSSFFSPLSAEVAAWSIAVALAGGLRLPPPEEQQRHVAERLRWMEDRTEGHHSRGTNVIPFSMHNIDEMLSDVGVDVSRLTRFKQWLVPVDPADYQRVSAELLRRHGPAGTLPVQQAGDHQNGNGHEQRRPAEAGR